MSDQKDMQTIAKAKGRPMLSWVGKKSLEKIEYFPAQEKEVYGDLTTEKFNQLFWGDNLQVLSHLLKDFRGKVDLLYIDPPFDSKADYVKKVKIRGEKVEGVQQNLLEEKQYTDLWENDEYLQFLYERLLVMKELVAEKGSIFIHCDWHKNAYIRIILDEIFGVDNFRNEIIWHYHDKFATGGKSLDKNHDTILHYSKTSNFIGNEIRIEKEETTKRALRKKVDGKTINLLDENGNKIYAEYNDKRMDDVWDIGRTISKNEYTEYPTQKKEELLVKIIQYGSNEGGLVLDCFAGSGTTLAVAQKLGRRWIGCDINIGAIQTTTKRLNQILEEQQSTQLKLTDGDFKGLKAFKVLNVNNYDIFKNELEAREIVMDVYGVEPVKQSYFDGILDNNFVKVLPLNRVLNKHDITLLLKNVNDSLDAFTVKPTTTSGEHLYEQGVVVICSGVELDAEDFLKKQNGTGVPISIKNILRDKQNLVFKKKPEAEVKLTSSGKTLTIEIADFYSPILMRRLELENEKMIDKSSQAKVEDFHQIIDSVAIDIDYNGELFNAEIMDLPDKKSVISGKYEHTYANKGKKRIAVKIVDVLGEEYFESFDVEVGA